MKQRRMSPRVKLKPEPVWEQNSRRSISQNDLARLAKISSGYLSQLICGRKSPSPEVRKRRWSSSDSKSYSSWSTQISNDHAHWEAILTPGVGLMPENFPARLAALKEMTGMSWGKMAAAMGGDCRQLHRWRRGTVPNGPAMLSLERFAARVPGGLATLIDEDPQPIRR